MKNFTFLIHNNGTPIRLFGRVREYEDYTRFLVGWKSIPYEFMVNEDGSVSPKNYTYVLSLNLFFLVIKLRWNQ